jgi:hypothetical protein
MAQGKRWGLLLGTDMEDSSAPSRWYWEGKGKGLVQVTHDGTPYYYRHRIMTYADAVLWLLEEHYQDYGDMRLSDRAKYASDMHNWMPFQRGKPSRLKPRCACRR